MAKHKAATEITIIQEERSGFAELVDRYKWHGLGLMIALGAVIFWRASSESSAVEQDRAAWAPLHKAFAKQGATTKETIAAINQTTSSGDDVVKSVANLLQAGLLASEGEFEDAGTAVDFASQTAPAFLKTLKVPAGENGEEQTILSSLTGALEREEEWKIKFHNQVYTNVLPEDAPRYKVETTAGTVVIGLHIKDAPAHAKNFMSQVAEGVYDGTLLHGPAIDGANLAIPGVRGGDLKTKDSEDSTTWGQETSDGVLNREGTDLTHEKGAVAAIIAEGQRKSSPTQFMILTEANHRNDSRYTVFGKVVEGLEIIEGLAELPLREGEAAIFEDPAKFISITKVE